ncbi:hypothetical protein WR25_10100 [Diploscapter pachys]|uniref:Uncharacterized protein n=1 Tax=Diploscapter pachys TaxID=2018661 RepID=A0A2A2JIW2_9BILA|nr:hypothetical protein WR25_10100 [Diploscapter pachys]
MLMMETGGMMDEFDAIPDVKPDLNMLMNRPLTGGPDGLSAKSSPPSTCSGGLDPYAPIIGCGGTTNIVPATSPNHGMLLIQMTIIDKIIIVNSRAFLLPFVE